MQNGELIHTKCREVYRKAEEEEHAKKAGISNFNGIDAGIHAGHASLRFGTCAHCHAPIYDEPNNTRTE
jgi:hypothetical protein